jgi:predicted TIM-barrel fold metal-dependent hydrolase
MKIIDAHTHIYPEKIAEKATKSVGDFYDLPMANSVGTSELLINAGNVIGVSTYLVCSVATTPTQVASINNFIARECEKHPQFFGFAAMHQDFEDIPAEIDRITALGLHGIKIHPDFQRFDIDSPQAYRIYEAIEGRIPILIHMGDARYTHSRPEKLLTAMKKFPKLRVIAAHLGGYLAWDEARVLKEVLGENLRFDTCSAISCMPKERALEQIRFFGAENCFFGTDFPMWGHEKELELLMELGLSSSELEGILAENFEKWFEI